MSKLFVVFQKGPQIELVALESIQFQSGLNVKTKKFGFQPPLCKPLDGNQCYLEGGKNMPSAKHGYQIYLIS